MGRESLGSCRRWSERRTKKPLYVSRGVCINYCFMITSHMGKNEEERLMALHAYEIMDSIREEEFDRITELASLICDVPISLVCLLDANRQWFKSRIGLSINETSRDIAFCQYTIQYCSIFEIEDAIEDDRFRNNPLVTADPNIRFYAGYPLIDPKGYALGTLCVIDRKPKVLTDKQKRSLQLLAQEVMQCIVERRQKTELRNFEKLFNFSEDLICLTKIDGFFRKVNPSFEKTLGWNSQFLLKTSYMKLIHPDDVALTQQEIKKIVDREATTLNFTHRFRSRTRQYRTLHWIATYDELTGDLYCIGRDVTEEKIKEQKLADSEQKLKIFFEHSQGLLSTYNLQGDFLSINSAFANALGYTKEEIFSLGLKGLAREESYATINDYLDCIRHTGTASGQMVALHKNGSQRIWMHYAFLERDPYGDPYVINNAVDITERHQIEVDLKRTKEMLEETNRVARIGGWEYNIRTQKLYWTDVIKEINGLELDHKPDIVKDITTFKEGESRNHAKAALELAITEGIKSDLELQIVTVQGKELWVRMLINTEMENNACKRIYGTFQDIDEKKKAELELKKAKKLLDDVLRAATEVSIIATDPEGLITVFNAGAEKMLSYSAEEMIGKQTPAIIHLADEIAARGKSLTEELGYVIEGFPQVFVTKPQIEGAESQEWTYVTKDGSQLTVQLVVTPMRDEEGAIKGYLGIAIDISDISDLKKAKSELRLLTKHLQAKNEQLLNFAHITSHNLRAPVSNLNSLLYLHKESTSQKDKELFFGKFETVVKHLTETLNELVESLKIQEDISKECEVLHFDTIFNKTQETLIGQIMELQALVTCDFSEADTIEYPKPYMESIMLNLFSNAIKYRAPDRIPCIHFQTYQGSSGIVLTVKDNGLGIDLKKHGHKLFGLHKTFHRHPEAKGVGLFLTKTQVEAMGGKISAESEVNQGTTFKIFFKIPKTEELSA